MNLQELVQKWHLLTKGIVPEIDVTGITENSQKVQPGYIFVAIPGEHTSGIRFIQDAVDKGAIAIISSQEIPMDVANYLEFKQVPVFYTSIPRKILGEALHTLLGEPSKKMKVIGITGTNGKTTTVFMVEQILIHAGFTVGRLGTLGYAIGDEFIDATHTTPFNEDLAFLFKKAYLRGLSHIVMEVSSHALAQDRVAGIEFTVGAFTNLTQDHLDFHNTMEEYRNAKVKLFLSLPKDKGIAVLNCSDPHFDFFAQACSCRYVTFGEQGDYHAKSVKANFRGTDFVLCTPKGKINLHMSLLGYFNVMNALCASAVCAELGVSLDVIQKGIETLQGVPGRFEVIDEGQNFTVVVDYAHTEDGLKNVLKTARDLTTGRVIVVFGCGGDRDKTKRPKMGSVAGTYADWVIITSDNPRTEDPKKILLDIEIGLQKLNKTKGKDYYVVENREEAIRLAIEKAKPNDIVVIAGKGHETYQIIGTQKFPFDDREVARKYLREKTK